MAGFLTNDVPNIPVFDGGETFPIDTNQAAGENPESGSMNLAQLAVALAILGNRLSVLGINGQRFVAGINIGFDALLTGIEVLVGSTGGTDKWIVELHDSAGVLVATSALAGVTAGTALTPQQIPFTAPYAAKAGKYFIALQSNGNTAYFQAINSPTWPFNTASIAGTFGVSANITPPTTYTADIGPSAAVYQ